MSKLRAFKEITMCSYNTPNHVYILNDLGHCVGYRKTGSKEYTQFNKPYKLFSRAHRKFIELKPASKYMV